MGSAPLWLAADVVIAGGYDGLVVVDEDTRILGWVRAEVVLRVAAKLRTAPLSVLPPGAVALTALGLDSLSALERREVLSAVLRSGGAIEVSGVLVPTVARGSSSED